MKRFYSWGLVALLLDLACPQSTRAQIVGKSVPAFTTAAGTLIRPGDTLRLGRGTLPNGDFQYVFVPDNVFTGSKQQNFTSQLSNLWVRVKDIRVQRSRNFGEKTVAVVKANTLNGCVDLNAAEAAGEIITAHTRTAAVSAPEHGRRAAQAQKALRPEGADQSRVRRAKGEAAEIAPVVQPTAPLTLASVKSLVQTQHQPRKVAQVG